VDRFIKSEKVLLPIARNWFTFSETTVMCWSDLR